MEDTTAPSPVTLDELIARWAERDAAYATNRKPLDPQVAEAVRAGRLREADHLPNPQERARAYARAKTWSPPVHQDFGSLRDWLS